MAQQALPSGYSDPSIYNKYASCSSCGGEKGKCGCHSEESCTDCPPGLVAIEDSTGEKIGCVSPSDAELYNNVNTGCAQGYVKYFNPATGRFMGCVTVADFLTLP